MAVFAIPNPKKTTQVDFSIERVKLSVLNISLINDKYKFTNANEIFNQYTYEALEFLSLGVFIDINLNTINDNKTEITVEIRRKIGTFNQAHEVTNANEHLVKIFDAIAKLTTMTPEQIEEQKNRQYIQKTNINKKTKTSFNSTEIQNPNAWYEKTWLVVLLCIIFFPVGLYALWKNTSIAKGWKITVTVIIAIILIANLGDKSDTYSTKATQNQSIDDEETNTSLEESKPDVEILKQTANFEESMDAYTIHCRVRNNTKELINYVDLKATFYDKKGNIVGTGIGNAANFAAGSEKTIDVIGLDIQNCDTYEVQIDNVMK